MRPLPLGFHLLNREQQPKDLIWKYSLVDILLSFLTLDNFSPLMKSWGLWGTVLRRHRADQFSLCTSDPVTCSALCWNSFLPFAQVLKSRLYFLPWSLFLSFKSFWQLGLSRIWEYPWSYLALVFFFLMQDLRSAPTYQSWGWGLAKQKDLPDVYFTRTLWCFLNLKSLVVCFVHCLSRHLVIS